MKIVFFLLKKKVGDFYVHSGSIQEFAKSIQVYVTNRYSSCVYFASSTLMGLAIKDEATASAVHQADILVPEGGPIVKNLRRKHRVNAVSIKREDLLRKVMELVSEEEVCFYGSTEWKSLYPKATFIKPVSDQNSVAAVLNDTGAGLIVVCLPESEQARWMQHMKGKVNACMLGMGLKTAMLEKWSPANLLHRFRLYSRL
ncbi:MAG: WecB/TagA/CpsF family glycosyltransferase [Leadbetterella sp.]|nr:WecB/TagA/CpsF family glycosyltransferase [Leadbetterella sp.]